MKKILAFGASSSKQSINKTFANYTADQVGDVEVTLLDLNDFEMPIYSIDREMESGVHELAKKFKQHIKDADGIIVSFAEHNGAYSAAFKNVYDWVSRVEKDVWEQKPMFLLATSSGPRGGQGVLEIASAAYSYANKNTIAKFSLPSFGQNFNSEVGISDSDLKSAFNSQLNIFKGAL